MSQFTDRMIRAAKLDVDLYEEVEADKTAMKQSVAVVVLSSLAAGIGSASITNPGSIILATIVSLIGWYVWAFMTYIIGTKILPERNTEADHGQLLRTIGFSAAPGILKVIGVIAPIRPLIFLVSGIWTLIAMVIAVRQALDYESTLRAVGVCMIGWFVNLLILAFLMMLISGANGSPGSALGL